MHIHDLQLLTDDPAAQRAFYVELLGLPEVAAPPQTCALQVGRSRLSFRAAPGWRGAYHFAFNIPENQLGQARAWLAARAPLIASAAGETTFDFAGWDAHALYCYDPAGNIVELIARHTLPNASDQPFSAASLLSVSEIGLATDDVRAAVAHLRARLGAEVYRGSLGDDFAAIGDAEGLLIIVRTGRIWYPDTGVPAEPHPVTLVVAGADGAPLTLDRSALLPPASP